MAEITKANPEENTVNSQSLKDEQMAQVDGGFCWGNQAAEAPVAETPIAEATANSIPNPSPQANIAIK